MIHIINNSKLHHGVLNQFESSTSLKYHYITRNCVMILYRIKWFIRCR